jgi:peptidyl-prolyl cis-trans isomerase B (cyclophilin B)
MTADNSSLDGYYAAFGQVIEGMDIVHNIEKVEVSSSSDDSSSSEDSTPVNDVIISTVTVETYGVDYGKPTTLDTWNYYDWIYETYGIDLRSYQQ